MTESGDATATGSVSIVSPAVSLNILDSITRPSTSSGTATDSYAVTDALSDLDMDVDNFSGKALTFSFEWSLVLEASATGDACAEASVDLFDDVGAFDIREIVNENFPDINTSGNFEFTLLSGLSNPISGFVDTFGEATALIPVPSAVCLSGIGLLSLVGVARRRRVVQY